MARTPFTTPAALIVVSSDGYFDVFPPSGRTANDRPVYRGELGELGPGIRSGVDRLGVRPDSRALDAAVTAWSGVNGAAAVLGTLGPGRDHKPVVQPA